MILKKTSSAILFWRFLVLSGYVFNYIVDELQNNVTTDKIKKEMRALKSIKIFWNRFNHYTTRMLVVILRIKKIVSTLFIFIVEHFASNPCKYFDF